MADANRTAPKINIRWLVQRDLPDVLQIERDSFPIPWGVDGFLYYLRQRNCIGMVAERYRQIVGFMLYELHKSNLRIINFAVAPVARRQDVGGQMVRRLIDKLSQQRRKEIVLEIRETNLPAQLFFRHEGFRAVCVIRDHYDDTQEDAYVMQFRLASSDDWLTPYDLLNRISLHESEYKE
jgi:ribosomal-protein-alanine N-acetyltransferase